MTTILGKQKGRDKLQQQKWRINTCKILRALGNHFPHASRIADLQAETGLDRKTMVAHLRGRVDVESINCKWRIKPDYFYCQTWKDYYLPGQLYVVRKFTGKITVFPLSM
jgi:hypothetical protein